jgi:hypothetical protein
LRKADATVDSALHGASDDAIASQVTLNMRLPVMVQQMAASAHVQLDTTAASLRLSKQ